MKRQAVRIFSRRDYIALQKEVNKFLETIASDDVVSVTNNQVDHDVRGDGFLHGQNFYVVYTVTVVYMYDYTQKRIDDEIRQLREEIAKGVASADVNATRIFLPMYDRDLPVKFSWGVARSDVLLHTYESEEYKTLVQEIVDKWHANHDPIVPEEQ